MFVEKLTDKNRVYVNTRLSVILGKWSSNLCD